MTEGASLKETTYPDNYDSQGKSLHYNFTAVARDLRCAHYMRTRPLCFGQPDTLQLVDIAFPDSPELPSPQYALKEYLRMSFGKKEIPVYIFDDHNHALFAWCEAFKEGHIVKGSQLWHIDHHDDAFKIEDFPLGENWSLAEIARLSQSLGFEEYIHPAIKLGLIKKVFWVQTTFSEKNHLSETESRIEEEVETIEGIPDSTTEPKFTIVNIDIDYFNDFLKNEEVLNQHIAKIKELMKLAGVITIATSPGFIDQEKAIEIIKRLLSE